MQNDAADKVAPTDRKVQEHADGVSTDLEKVHDEFLRFVRHDLCLPEFFAVLMGMDTAGVERGATHSEAAGSSRTGGLKMVHNGRATTHQTTDLATVAKHVFEAAFQCQYTDIGAIGYVLDALLANLQAENIDVQSRMVEICEDEGAIDDWVVKVMAPSC